MSYRLSGPADDDLETILWYGLERFGERQTDLYLDELERAFEFLGEHPLVSRLRTEIAPPVRVYPLRAHVITYEVEAGGVLILRIRSARENWITNPLGSKGT